MSISVCLRHNKIRIKRYIYLLFSVLVENWCASVRTRSSICYLKNSVFYFVILHNYNLDQLRIHQLFRMRLLCLGDFTPTLKLGLGCNYVIPTIYATVTFQPNHQSALSSEYTNVHDTLKRWTLFSFWNNSNVTNNISTKYWKVCFFSSFLFQSFNKYWINLNIILVAKMLQKW